MHDGGAHWWEILAAIAAAAGAIASAIAAGAAWKSAGASERTSRESRLALGAAIRPTLKVRVEPLDERLPGRAGTFAVGVANISPWDAVDLDVEAMYRDGEVVKGSAERVAAHDVEPYALELRPAELVHESDPALVSVVVRYSDAQRIARHQIRQEFEHRDTGSPIVSQTEEQIGDL